MKAIIEEYMGKRVRFPRGAKYNKVMGILRLLFHNNKKLSISELTTLSSDEVDELLPQVTAARLLGFVKVSKGMIFLTKIGEKMHVLDDATINASREKLLRYEPFKSAYELSKKNHTFSTEDLEKVLLENKVYWYSDQKENLRVLNEMLMQWAIRFNIVDYDGTEKVWIEE